MQSLLLPDAEQPWFYANLARAEAEGLCKAPGDFLVRHKTCVLLERMVCDGSSSDPSRLVITVMKPDWKLAHIEVQVRGC